MFQVWICIERSTRKYIEFGDRQAQNYVYPMAFLWCCLFTGSLDPGNYPIRLSAGLYLSQLSMYIFWPSTIIFDDALENFCDSAGKPGGVPLYNLQAMRHCWSEEYAPASHITTARASQNGSRRAVAKGRLTYRRTKSYRPRGYGEMNY